MVSCALGIGGKDTRKPEPGARFSMFLDQCNFGDRIAPPGVV